MSVFAAAGLAGGLFAACGGSGSSTPGAAQWRAHNPAALLGGRTIVGTANGQRLTGGPTNDTIVAFGPNETIVGGSGVDQMGAFASNVTIIGGTRSDVIYGGPNATLVSGPAPDLLIDTHDNGTIRLTGDGDEVMLTGHNDHVVCAPTSHNDVIYSNRSDSVDPTCSANNARLYGFDQSPPKAGLHLVSTTTPRIQGSGTNADPYVAPCDNPNLEDCTVSFDDRWLDGAGGGEPVPAYRCPGDHPYLFNQNFAPYGTSVVTGVEIVESSNPWSINVYIPNATVVHPPPGAFANGTRTGDLTSGATNWGPYRNSYRIVLHCTSNPSHGWLGEG